MKLQCMIVDDEPVARKGLAEYVADVDFLELIETCENAVKASAVLNERPVDLIFLDIQMPKLTGIEFLRTLAKPPMVIFTTAYSEYAVEGYALDVVDYLMKPITFERFLKSAQKAFEIDSLKKIGQRTDTKADHFFVKSESRFEKILFGDVLYIEGMQNYAIIHTATRKLITYLTLSSLESQLPAGQFLKVHKSFIIAKAHVKAIDGSEIVIGNSRIPVSRNLKDEVMACIMGSKLFKR